MGMPIRCVTLILYTLLSKEKLPLAGSWVHVELNVIKMQLSLECGLTCYMAAGTSLKMSRRQCVLGVSHYESKIIWSSSGALPRKGCDAHLFKRPWLSSWWMGCQGWPLKGLVWSKEGKGNWAPLLIVPSLTQSANFLDTVFWGVLAILRRCGYVNTLLSPLKWVRRRVLCLWCRTLISGLGESTTNWFNWQWLRTWWLPK